jgi:hypothetical protein
MLDVTQPREDPQFLPFLGVLLAVHLEGDPSVQLHTMSCLHDYSHLLREAQLLVIPEAWLELDLSHSWQAARLKTDEGRIRWPKGGGHPVTQARDPVPS